MKWIKTYQNYKKKESIQESKIFDFLKSKWSDVVQKFKDLKGQAYIKLISSFIPRELKESIFGEVKKLKTQNESLILEELLNKELFFSDEKIDNLSDKEYEEYIQKLSEISSKNPNFLPSNIEGDTDKSKSQIIEFLTQRGVKIDSEIKYNFKPSIEKINSNIDRLEISNTSKKILKVCSLILFFGLLMTKTEDALASGGDVVKDIDIPAGTNMKLEWIEGSTDATNCSNTTLYKFGLPPSNKQFYETTVGELKSKIGASESEILKDFKPVDFKTDAKDYVQIGGKKLSDSGSEFFSIADDNAKIIASKNGLLALTRIVREADKNVDYDLVKISFKETRQSGAHSVDLKSSLNNNSRLNDIFGQFETAVTPKSKIEQDSRADKLYNNLIELEESEKINMITKNINSKLTSFVPKGDSNKYDFKKIDPQIVKGIIDKSKGSQKIDVEEFEKSIVDEYKNLYLQNVKIFCDKNFPPEMSKKLVSDFEVNSSFEFKLKPNHNIWKKQIWKSGTSDVTSISKTKTEYDSGK